MPTFSTVLPPLPRISTWPFPSPPTAGPAIRLSSERARTELAGLRDGDTLRELRDDARLSRITIAFSDERPFTDVDSEADYERLKAYMRSSRAIDASL